MKHTKLIKKLIQIPSVSGEEKQIQEFIFGWLEQAGLDPEWQGENLVARIAGVDESRALIFNAHVDTVSAGDPKAWSEDPFAGVVEGDKIYGLGASDEKAGVASLMLLGKQLLKAKPAVDVWLVFVVGEEVDGKGTRSFVDWWTDQSECLHGSCQPFSPSCDPRKAAVLDGGPPTVATRSRFLPLVSKYSQTAAVLVEPTGLEAVEIGHKGNVFVKLTARGDSGHGSRPREVKINSVLTMAKALIELDQLGRDWAKQYKDPILGAPTIGIGTSIQAGDSGSPNKFADTCVATVDVRTVPAMHDQVKTLFEKCLEEYPVTVEHLYEPCGFGLTEKNDPLVEVVQLATPGVAVGISPGATDQCFFSQAGIPAVVIGPGEKETMHLPDEWCYLSKIDKAVELYEKIVEEWGRIGKGCRESGIMNNE